MNPIIKKLFSHIQREYALIAPTQKSRGLFLSTVTDLKKIVFSAQLTHNTFKDFLFPQHQTLYRFEGETITEPNQREYPKQALFGIQIVDLRALGLYNQVFRHDAVYQAIKQRTLVIGYLKGPVSEKSFGIFKERLEEDTLEHLEFDIFVLETGTGSYLYAGSKTGRTIITEAGLTEYENSVYVGPIKESGLDPVMVVNYRKVKNSFERHRSVWEELGKRCLACGKCSLVCPTCFCFTTNYEFGQKKKSGQRQRHWETCFYPDFSKVAGGHIFLDTIAKRIYFWYEHKFVRIPDEYSIPGCVGCGRCIAVCPVGIDLRKTLAALTPAPAGGKSQPSLKKNPSKP